MDERLTIDILERAADSARRMLVQPMSTIICSTNIGNTLDFSYLHYKFKQTSTLRPYVIV